MVKRVVFATLLVVALAALIVAFAYAGSPSRIAGGVTIAGVDVGGLTAAEAERRLERRAAALDRVPLVIRVGRRTYRLRASQLGIAADWRQAVAKALDRGDGTSPFRGFRRLYLSLAGADVSPPAVVYRPGLEYRLERMARAVDVPHREAAIALRGLRPVVVPGRTGRLLDRKAAEAILVERVTSLRRGAVTLPLRKDPPKVTGSMLAPALRQARLAVSAPVRLTLGGTRYVVPRWRIAELLDLPENGARAIRIAGPAADRYFARLAREVGTKPKDARFEPLPGGEVKIVPSVPGRTLDAPRTAQSLLAAAVSPADRVAPIVVGLAQPERTTKDAKAMGITGLVSSYTTHYGGVANRIHNVQLVSRLIDDTLIAPGKEFSFNATTGERNEAKGFRAAPVIINGELQTALGGGVCQVSTTVFNAAYEAGLKITARTNHYLYISHYPQGRDATVNYPDIDLKFVNDTGHWLLLRTFVGPSSLTVNLYGTPTGRRVESETAPLRVTGGPPTELVKDPTLPKGKRVVEQPGSPSLATSVRRRVYDADGKLLHDDVWYSSYRGEKRVIRVGTKPKPKVKNEDAVATLSRDLRA